MTLDPREMAYHLAGAGWEEGADAINVLIHQANARTTRDRQIRGAAQVYIAKVRQLVGLILDEES